MSLNNYDSKGETSAVSTGGFKRMTFSDWLSSDDALFKDNTELAISQGFAHNQSLFDRFILFYKLNPCQQKYWHKQHNKFNAYLYISSR